MNDYECMIEVIRMENVGLPNQSVILDQTRISGDFDIPKLNRIGMSYGTFLIMTGHGPAVGDSYLITASPAARRREDPIRS